MATFLLASSALALTVTPVGAASSSSTTSDQEDKTVKIALVYPREGARLDFYGTWLIQGFKLGMQYATGDDSYEPPYEMNGNTFEMKIYNTEASPQTGAQKAREAIINWGADILVGACSSSVAASIEKIAEQNGVPYFISAASAGLTQTPKFNKYIFRVGRNTWHDALAAGYYYGKKQDINNIAYIGIDYSFGKVGVETGKKAFARYGVEAVGTEFIPPGTPSFKPYITRIKEKNPEKIYIVWAGTGFGSLFQELEKQGLRDKVIGSVIDLFTMSRIQFATEGEYLGVEGSCFFQYDAMKGKQYDWMKEHTQQEGLTPDSFAKAFSTEAGDWADQLSKANVPESFYGNGFATAQFIVEGLKNQDYVIEGNVTGENGLIAEWEGMELQTPYGSTYIRPYDHQAVRPMTIAKVVMDNESGSETEGLLIAERVKEIPRKFVDPPIKTDYVPYVTPYEVTASKNVVTPEENAPPMTVDFSAEALQGKEPYTYSWDFGDDSTGSGASVSHEYQEGGEYTVTLTVGDSADSLVKKTLSVSVPTKGGGGGTSTLVWVAIAVVIIVVIGVVGYTQRS